MYNHYMETNKANKMNEAVKAAALELAAKMVAHWELEAHCNASELQEDKNALRKAYNEMCDAQNNLYLTVQLNTNPL